MNTVVDKAYEKVYRKRPGYGIGIKESEVVEVASFMDRLYESNGGGLTPTDVVEAARPTKSPLHPYFTWDPTQAAAKWWKEEARVLMRTFEVNFVTPSGETVRTRQFFSVEFPDEDKDNDQPSPKPKRNGAKQTAAEVAPRYVPVELVMANPDLHEQLEKRFARELKSATARYESLRSLPRWQPIFALIDAIPEGT